jgi:hypothetical protein
VSFRCDGYCWRIPSPAISMASNRCIRRGRLSVSSSLPLKDKIRRPISEAAYFPQKHFSIGLGCNYSLDIFLSKFGQAVLTFIGTDEILLAKCLKSFTPIFQLISESQFAKLSKIINSERWLAHVFSSYAKLDFGFGNIRVPSAEWRRRKFC